jgi:hypothetical protein
MDSGNKWRTFKWPNYLNTCHNHLLSLLLPSSLLSIITVSLSLVQQMHRHPIALLALSWAGLASAAKFLHSVPEDPFAFPKYRVSFLNGLPVLNETAERWLQHGLKGGEHEFLDQPWDEPLRDQPPTRREIGNGDDDENVSDESQVAIVSILPYTIQTHILNPRASQIYPHSVSNT